MKQQVLPITNNVKTNKGGGLVYFHLFEKTLLRRGDTKASSISCCTPQEVAAAGAGLAKSLEPRASLGSPTPIQTLMPLGHHPPMPSQMHEQGATGSLTGNHRKEDLKKATKSYSPKIVLYKL